MRVPGRKESNGCQPPVSRDAASWQPKLGPTRSAPPPASRRPSLSQAAGARGARCPSPSGPIRVAAQLPRRDGKVQASAPTGPGTALRKTTAAKPAAPARRARLGPAAAPARVPAGRGAPAASAPHPGPVLAPGLGPPRSLPTDSARRPRPPPSKARASLRPPTPAAPNSTDPLPVSAPAPSPLPAQPAPGRAPPLPGIWRRRRRVRTRPEAREPLSVPGPAPPPPLASHAQPLPPYAGTHLPAQGLGAETHGAGIRKLPEVAWPPASGAGREGWR